MECSLSVSGSSLKSDAAHSQTGRTHRAAPPAHSLIKNWVFLLFCKFVFSPTHVLQLIFQPRKHTEAFSLLTYELFTCQPVSSCACNNDGTPALTQMVDSEQCYTFLSFFCRRLLVAYLTMLTGMTCLSQLFAVIADWFNQRLEGESERRKRVFLVYQTSMSLCRLLANQSSSSCFFYLHVKVEH